MRRRQRGNVVVAGFLMVLGLWIAVSSVGLPLPGFGQIWPVLFIIFGLAALVQASGGGAREQGLVFSGVLTVMSGGLLLPFTLGALPWRDMALYWPAFPLFIGLAFLAVYLAGGMRDSGLLVPAFAIGGVGAASFPFTLGAVQNPLLNRLAQLWPIYVVILALAFLFRPALRKSTDGDAPADIAVDDDEAPEEVQGADSMVEDEPAETGDGDRPEEPPDEAEEPPDEDAGE